MSTPDKNRALSKALEQIDEARSRHQGLFGEPEVNPSSQPLQQMEKVEESNTSATENSPRPSTPKKQVSALGYVKYMLFYVLLAWLGIHLLLGVFQRQLIYLGSKNPAGDPLKYGFNEGTVREFSLKVDEENQVVLAGWQVFPPGITQASWDRQLKELTTIPPQPEAYHSESVILYFPGNAGHRGYRHDTLKDLASLKAHVVIFDYRGYSDSTGAPSEQALIADAEKMYLYLKDVCKFDPAKIILFGESLGGGVATQLAANLVRKKLPLGGLIIQSSFDSLENVAQRMYRFLAVRWLMLDKFQSINHMPAITCPLLSIHGDQDEIVPLELGKKLFDAAPDRSNNGIMKEFYLVTLCGHNDVREAGGWELKFKIGAFIRKVEAAAK